MSYNKNLGYQNNQLMGSTSKQLSFLFGRIVYLIEEADRLRLENHFAEFAEYNQRALSIIHGLMSFFEEELTQNACNAWGVYFSKILTRLNYHMIEPNPIHFKQICYTLKHMESLLKDIDTNGHTLIHSSIIENEIANDNLNAPTNHNLDNTHHDAVTSNTLTDINFSV